jgi:uncharacterized membrane protein YkoI
MFSRRGTLIVGLYLPFSLAARASDDDHERARLALQRGEIRSLTDILREVGAELGGEVIEVEFENRNRRRNYAYQFKVLTPDGRVSEVLVDAATARILEREDD